MTRGGAAQGSLHFHLGSALRCCGGSTGTATGGYHEGLRQCSRFSLNKMNGARLQHSGPWGDAVLGFKVSSHFVTGRDGQTSKDRDTNKPNICTKETKDLREHHRAGTLDCGRGQSAWLKPNRRGVQREAPSHRISSDLQLLSCVCPGALITVPTRDQL